MPANRLSHRLQYLSNVSGAVRSFWNLFVLIGGASNTEKIIFENGFAQDFSRIFCFLLDFNFSDYIYKKAITSYKSDSLLDTIYGFHLLISDFSNCSISFCTVFLCHSHSFYHSACLIVIIRNCRIKNLFSFFQIFLPC